MMPKSDRLLLVAICAIVACIAMQATVWGIDRGASGLPVYAGFSVGLLCLIMAFVNVIVAFRGKGTE